MSPRRSSPSLRSFVLADADLDVTPCAGFAQAMAFLGGGESGSDEKQLLIVKGPSRFRGALNHFFASRPRHPFWTFALGRLRNYSKRDIMGSTGPLFVGASWREYTKAVAAVGGCPRPLNATTRTVGYLEFERVFAGHHWSSTWHRNGSVSHDPTMYVSSGFRPARAVSYPANQS